MSRVVLGIGTSHSPLLTFTADMWLERGKDDMRNAGLTLSDGRTVSYAALLAERGEQYAQECLSSVLESQAAKTQVALDYIAEAVAKTRPDVVLIIGDDQEEIYKLGNTPSLAVYYGDEVVMRPLGEILEAPPEWMSRCLDGYAMDTANRFAGAPEFALDLIDRLMDAGVDLGVLSSISDPEASAFGHAYGFIARRLLQNGAMPIVPILLNTYYPPNVIRPARCLDIGKKICAAIEAMPGDLRVAVVASGGLSHFVTDAALDHSVLTALREKDWATLEALPMHALRAGSSEILCWVMAGGVFGHLSHQWSEYIPVYRTPAGTGIGLGFGVWS